MELQKELVRLCSALNRAEVNYVVIVRQIVNMRKLFALLFLIYGIMSFSSADAEDAALRPVKSVQAQGSCAVVGMSAEQSQLMALQRARVAAIEQAAGIKVTSATVVTNDRLAVDFIKTYSKGLIVNEKVEWLPLGQYQKDKSSPPIPEYTVKITVDVYEPVRKVKPAGLSAEINDILFKNGKNGSIKINVKKNSKIAIFNITADDKVVMLFPNQYERDNAITGGNTLIFPAKDSQIELEMQTLPGHKRDAEAFFIVAMDGSHERQLDEIFKPLEPMGFSEFFAKYSEIADYCEDKVIAYEVGE